MLYAIALLLNIPVIYEHPTEGAAYIPNNVDGNNTNSIMGGGNSGMNDDSNTSMNDIQPNQLNIPKTPTIYQRGGANLTLTNNGIFSQNAIRSSHRTSQYTDDDKNMAIYILENPVYMLALTPFICNDAYTDSTSNFKTAIESILALDYTTFVNKSPEPIIPSRSRINPSPHITNPAYTTYLRKVITKNTNMDTLIGPQYTQDNTDNNTDIKIIYLSYTPAIYNIRGSTYTLIYKYGHTGDTYNNDYTGRNLYIMNGNKALSQASVSEQFGVAKIIGLFRNGAQIDSNSSEKIEEMIGELIAIGTSENGYSITGNIFKWGFAVAAIGIGVSKTNIGSAISQKYFNRDELSKGGGSKIGGKISPLSDSSINSSVEPDAAEPAQDDSSINSSVDSSIKSSEQDDDDSKQSEEKYPLLTKNDNYYAVAFNYTQTHKIIRDHGVNLPFYDDLCNVFTMFSYLWLFNKYVINVCIDDEETAIAYDQWSVKGKAQSVAGEAESVTSKAQSVAGEAESVTSEAQSVAGESQSVAGDAESVAGESQSVAGEAQSDTSEAQSDTSEAQSVAGEAQSVAGDAESVTGDSRTVLIPTHKSLYILFDKMADIIKKEGTLPFLLTDLEQVLFDEKDYMYFQLQQIKRYVLRDDFIEVVEEKVDEPIVSEAKVDEPTVSEAKVDEAAVDEAKVDEPPVDKPPVSEAKVDEPSLDKPPVSEAKVDKPPVGKEIILKFIKEANDEEQTVNTELSRLSETDNFDDLLKYAIDRNLTRYGMFYMYSDYLTYISTLSMKKSTPSDSSESSTVDNSIKTTTLDNSNDNSIDNSIKSSTLDNSNDNSIDNSNESTTLDNSNESSPVDNSNDNSIKSTSIYSNSNKSSSFDKNSKSSSFDKNSKSSSLDNSIDNNSTSSSVSSAILSRGGIHKKKSSKINRKTKVHRVTKNKRKVSESRKSKKKKHSKRKLLAKKKRGTRKNNRKNRK